MLRNTRRQPSVDGLQNAARSEEKQPKSSVVVRKLGATRSRQNGAVESKQARKLKSWYWIKGATKRRENQRLGDPDASGCRGWLPNRGGSAQGVEGSQVGNTQHQKGRREDGRGVWREPGEVQDRKRRTDECVSSTKLFFPAI